MIKDRKAQIGETMTLALAGVIIVAIFIIFMLISMFVTGGVSKTSETIAVGMADKDRAMVSLMAYVNTPVEVDGDNMTIANLIRMAYRDDKYEEILKTKSKEIFDPLYKQYLLHVGQLSIKSISAKPDEFARKQAILSLPVNNAESVQIKFMIKDET